MTTSHRMPSHEPLEHYPQVEPAASPHCPACASLDTRSLGPVQYQHRLVERRICHHCGEHFLSELDSDDASAPPAE